MIYDDQTSSAMNYYEELGVGPEATDLDIRKAHRRLVKLMHPDAQPDQSLKMLAETQMRRLNSIVSTLLDPIQRSSYDEQLRTAHAPFRHTQADRRSWRGIPWWLASSIAAVVLTLVAVWLWADHLGSSFGTTSVRTIYIPSSENPAGAVPSPASTRTQPDPDRTKPLGASYTPPINTQPPQSVSDQPNPSKSGGISATVITDPPAVAKTPVPMPPTAAPVRIAKQLPVAIQSPPLAKLSPPAKPEQKRSVSVVVQDVPQAKPQPALQLASQPKHLMPLMPANKKQELTIVAGKTEISKTVTNKTVTNVATAKLLVPKAADQKTLLAHNVFPPRPAAVPPSKPVDTLAPNPNASVSKRMFTLPAGSLIARVSPNVASESQIPSPPRVSALVNRDYSTSSLPGSNLPAAAALKVNSVTTAASPATSGSAINSQDPLEGEWVYAPKEPERQRAGFYPPEFIDLKLFGSGDPGNLKGQYSAKYVVSDRPVASEVYFELASSSKGSRKFLWQGNNGAKGTLNVDTIDDRTIRIDWHTTSAVHGPTLTSGTATLIRRQ